MPALPIADKTTLDAVNTKVGTNTDVAGTSTLFASLALLAAYVDQLEGYVDALETNVGSNADAASATGSAHAKLKELRTLVDTLETNLTAARAANLDNLDIPVSLASSWGSFASDTLQMSADAECWTTSLTAVKAKAFRARYGGAIRVKFEYHCSGPGGTAKVDIRKNGVSLGGGETSVTAYSGNPNTQDIDVGPGDYIDVYVYAKTSGTAYVKNVRVYYDISQDVTPTVSTNLSGSI